jgi:hypothetical protein
MSFKPSTSSKCFEVEKELRRRWVCLDPLLQFTPSQIFDFEASGRQVTSEKSLQLPLLFLAQSSGAGRRYKNLGAKGTAPTPLPAGPQHPLNAPGRNRLFAHSLRMGPDSGARSMIKSRSFGQREEGRPLRYWRPVP